MNNIKTFQKTCLTNIRLCKINAATLLNEANLMIVAGYFAEGNFAAENLAA